MLHTNHMKIKITLLVKLFGFALNLSGSASSKNKTIMDLDSSFTGTLGFT